MGRTSACSRSPRPPCPMPMLTPNPKPVTIYAKLQPLNQPIMCVHLGQRLAECGTVPVLTRNGRMAQRRISSLLAHLLPTTCPMCSSGVNLQPCGPLGHWLRFCQKPTSWRTNSNKTCRSRMAQFPAHVVRTSKCVSRNALRTSPLACHFFTLDESNSENAACQAQCPIVCFKASTVLQGMGMMPREHCYPVLTKKASTCMTHLVHAVINLQSMELPHYV